MNILKEIRLNDLKERGASFIRDEEIKTDVCSGTLYYYYDKYDEDISSAEVTVHYFPRGGAEIIGPHPKSREGFDKLMGYMETLSKDSAIKEKVRLRKMVSLTFLALKTVIILAILRNLACALTTGDIEIWERTILEAIMLTVVQMAQLRSLRL